MELKGMEKQKYNTCVYTHKDTPGHKMFKLSY